MSYALEAQETGIGMVETTHTPELPAEQLPQDRLEDRLTASPNMVDLGRAATEHDTTQFVSHFTGCMEMYADPATVAAYLDEHQGWFRRCAHPIQVESIGANAYALCVGRYGALGYDVEPKVGLDLLPQDQGVYRILTVPVPDYVPRGYDVDFQAVLQLETADGDPQCTGVTAITHANWTLDLTVEVQFPRFIQALPGKLIQQTGDGLLNQIVRQVSRRLTYKVQEDFHTTHGLPKPPRRHLFSRRA
ncbi:MAG: DUF1997 domain-containing protein [Cyanobacteria bacterium P01_H01_bin.121]